MGGGAGMKKFSRATPLTASEMKETGLLFCHSEQSEESTLI
jgi:hypothetical protein